MAKDVKNVFVLMPFAEDFDDVYLAIRDAVSAAESSLGRAVRCARADDSRKPGRITEQIIESIRQADVLIADLSGNNANVMYELGYGHALGKPSIILNQEIGKAPFDVADFRQIVYHRNRLVKDCRPNIVAALTDVFGEGSEESGEVLETGETLGTTPSSATARQGAGSSPLRPGAQTVALLQEVHLELRLAGTKSDAEEVRKLAARARDLLGRITVASAAEPADIGNTAAVAGNCAVSVESAGLSEEAEDLYRRILGLFPQYHGVHIQYADFLVDAGRMEEAREELRRATELDPSDRRIGQVRAKIAVKLGAPTPEIAEDLKAKFDLNPGDRESAVSYLLYLDRTGAPLGQFEEVCNRWRDAAPSELKHEADRALADHLAQSDHAEQEERAVHLYESLLCDASLQSEDRYAVLHNVATLYSMLGRKDLALSRWKEAYRLNPKDPAVKAAFSQRLASWGKLKMALAVIQGRDLPEEEPAQESK